MDEEEAAEEYESPKERMDRAAVSTSHVIPSARKDVVASGCLAPCDLRRNDSRSSRATLAGRKRKNSTERLRELPCHSSRAVASTGASSARCASVFKSEVVEISEDTALVASSTNTSSASSSDYVQKLKPSSLKHIKRKRRDAWLNLLKSRPDDDQGDEMSAWLMAVNSVSDPKWGKTLTHDNKSIAEKDEVDSFVTTSSSSAEYVSQQKTKRRRKTRERYYSPSSSSSTSSYSFSSVSTLEEEEKDDDEKDCRFR